MDAFYAGTYIASRERLHRSRCSSKAFVPSHRYQGIYRGVTRDRDNRNRMIHVRPRHTSYTYSPYNASTNGDPVQRSFLNRT